MRLLYFAWLKQKVGHSEEEVTLPEEVSNVEQLLGWLAQRGDNYAAANYRMIWLSGEGSGGDRRFAAVWVRNFEGYTTDVVWDLDGQTYQETAEARACSGYRPLVVTVYGAANDPRYGAIFLRTDGPNWEQQPHYVARHNQSGSELQDVINDFGPTTMQPSCIVESGAAVDRKFAFSWFDDTGARVLTKTGLNVPGLEPFDGAMSSFVQTRKIPAASIAVTKDEKLVFARAYTFAPSGYPVAQPETRFRSASVSKAITAVAIMKLIEDRRDDELFSSGVEVCSASVSFFEERPDRLLELPELDEEPFLASFMDLRLAGPRTGVRGRNTQPTCSTGLPPMRRPSSNSQPYWPWNSWNESFERTVASARSAMRRTKASPLPMAPAGGETISPASTASS